MPTGSVIPFAGSSAPTNWLLCFGQNIDRTTYSSLFSVIGTTYGVGDGSTTFALPDLRGRVVAGVDNMGGTDAGRLSVANTLGTATGAETVTIASANLPLHQHAIDHDHAAFNATSGTQSADHTHTGTTNNQGTNHAHSYTTVYLYTGNLDYGFYYNGYYPTGSTTGINNNSHAHSFTSNTTSQNHTHTTSVDVPAFTGSSGNGGFANTALDKMQPTIILNYIIRT
jgi:microcystin-dependent protein